MAKAGSGGRADWATLGGMALPDLPKWVKHSQMRHPDLRIQASEGLARRVDEAIREDKTTGSSLE
jgi:hypothetical protein